MNAHALSLALLTASLSACAQTAAVPAKEPAPASAQATKTSALDAQVVYQFLLGEVAAQRGELRLSAEAFADLAAKTRDARVARRATEVAMYARQSKLALRNAQLWQELEPDSVKARQTLASLLVSSGKLDEAKPHLTAWIRASKPEQVFMQLHSMFARQTDKQRVVDLVAELVALYPDLPEAQLALAQLAWQGGMGGKALTVADEALRLRPGWPSAALFKAQVLQQKTGEPAAGEFFAEFLAQYPRAWEVRHAYAKHLARTGQGEAADAAFAAVSAEVPDNPEPLVARGLLAMQADRLDAAAAHFSAAMQLGYTEEGTLIYLLGQVDEARGHIDAAAAHYRAVSGRQQMDAHLRLAAMLAKAGRLPEARAWLAQMRDSLSEGKSPHASAERVSRIAQTEAQLLREARQHQEAFAVLDSALRSQPDNLELLYDRAMAAERLGRLDVLEKDLRRMIELKPDYAHAYNALGYTLADRTSRLTEAVSLLEKALNLAPEDPFILDSMGWALFKAKRYGESAQYLRRAHAARPDPDIAAHLGEVLWVMGERDEARRIWHSGLKADPENESLRETLSRLSP